MNFSKSFLNVLIDRCLQIKWTHISIHHHVPKCLILQNRFISDAKINWINYIKKTDTN